MPSMSYPTAIQTRLFAADSLSVVDQQLIDNNILSSVDAARISETVIDFGISLDFTNRPNRADVEVAVGTFLNELLAVIKAAQPMTSRVEFDGKCLVYKVDKFNRRTNRHITVTRCAFLFAPIKPGSVEELFDDISLPSALIDASGHQIVKRPTHAHLELVRGQSDCAALLRFDRLIFELNFDQSYRSPAGVSI